jgi:hypothetical protein
VAPEQKDPCVAEPNHPGTDTTQEMCTNPGVLIFQLPNGWTRRPSSRTCAIRGHRGLRWAITKFLVNLKRHHRDLFESLEGSFSERYLTRKGQGVFSMG